MSVVLILVSGALIAGFSTYYLRNRRRSLILSQPFPADWTRILKMTSPICAILPAELQVKLEKAIQTFLHEKTFFGCGGLQITDEMRVTIAAQACLLVIGRDASPFSQQQSIFVYPSTFLPDRETWNGLIMTEGKSANLGEAWKRGPVVLAWDAVLKGAFDVHDGQNVVMHEFAHQLDFEDGASDGTPILSARTRYKVWSLVMGKEYARLYKEAEEGRDSLLDHYGATNAAEFFAVVTEVFFEKPEALVLKHPKLYEELKDFYNLDPVSWKPAP